MSEAETTRILASFEAGNLTPAQAVRALVDSGVGRAEAEELVFIAEGGSDVVEL